MWIGKQRGKEMAPQRRQQSRAGFGWQRPTTIALATTLTSVAIVAPARTAVLRDWTFDPTTRQLIVTLPTGVTPNYFLLAQPARIVLNVPNTSLGDAQRIQQHEGAIRNIRLSETQNGARVVLEFAPNTLLDPRHAELSSTDLGNGQTQWTLIPLLQGDAGAAIATTPAPVAANDAPPRTETLTTPESVSAPATAHPSDSAAPIVEINETPQVTDSAPLPQLATRPQNPSEVLPEETSTVAPDPPSEPSDALSTDDEMSSEAATDTSEMPVLDIPDEQPQETVSIPVTPLGEEISAGEVSQDADVSESSALAIATSATTGAVQSLPTGPDPFHGVSTDASVLAGVGNDLTEALPPEQLPINPFAIANQSSVSVPDSEASNSRSAPQVSVPSLANVPEAPASPALAQTSSDREALEDPALSDEPETTEEPAPIASSQARDLPPVTPSPGNVAVPPPPASSEASNQSTPQISATAPSEIAEPETTDDTPVAANSIDIPIIPLPPTSWSDRANSSPNQVWPEGETIAQVPDASIPPPPGTEVETAAASPPFLSTADKPISTEQPSIPPPPSTSADGTVPFGMPLPQTKSFEPEVTPVSTGISVPEGSRIALQYTGEAPLILEQPGPVYEILIVTANIYHPDTGTLILPMGSQVLGRFEGFDESGRRFVAQMSINGSDRRPLLAESDWMVGTTHVSGRNVSVGSSLGAVAVTVLSGFSGIGLLGGAAIGAAAGVVQSPTVVTVEPGQIIEVHVVSEILNFNDAPGITQAPPQ